MESKLFGTLPTGEEIYIYTLKNRFATLEVMERGATIVKFEVFGKDIIGGFETLDDYLKDTSYQGAIIGRIANRVANAKFTMDGKEYTLPKNDNDNCLHGGEGFNSKVWKLVEFTESSLTFFYKSMDMEDGFPSELDVCVTYTLEESAFKISYKAIPYGKTPIALMNHSYFNLNGFGSTIDDHKAKIYAYRYTAVDEMLIPNGERPCVQGTAFDFRDEHTIGERCSDEFIGYDHNFVLSGEVKENVMGEELALCACVSGEELSMKVYTDQPGVQFYIGNFLGDNEPLFRGGHKPIFHGAFCFETQTEPDCVNHGEAFYDKGQVYTHTTVYKVERL